MALRATIPGLDRLATKKDLEKSRNIYSHLPDDHDQPLIEPYLEALAELFVENGAQEVFGIHLVHGHNPLPQDTVLVGENYATPRCRWAKPSAITTVDLRNIHGHIFVLTDDGYRPYEYQTGSLPDYSTVSDDFLTRFAAFLWERGLTKVIGLEVLEDLYNVEMTEVVVGHQGTFMLEASRLKGCIPYRETGWRFEAEKGTPRVCKGGIQHHGTGPQGSHIVVEGSLGRRLECVEDVWRVLLEEGHIL